MDELTVTISDQVITIPFTVKRGFGNGGFGEGPFGEPEVKK